MEDMIFALGFQRKVKGTKTEDISAMWKDDINSHRKCMKNVVFYTT